MGSTAFDEFCEALDKPIFGLADLLGLGEDSKYEYDPETRVVTFEDGLALDVSILNYARYIREVRGCSDLYWCFRACTDW